MFKLCENCMRYWNIVLPWESANEKLALKEPIWHSEREYTANKYNITLHEATWLWPFFPSVFTSRQYIVLYMYSFNQTLYIYLLSPSIIYQRLALQAQIYFRLPSHFCWIAYKRNSYFLKALFKDWLITYSFEVPYSQHDGYYMYQVTIENIKLLYVFIN